MIFLPLLRIATVVRHKRATCLRHLYETSSRKKLTDNWWKNPLTRSNSQFDYWLAEFHANHTIASGWRWWNCLFLSTKLHFSCHTRIQSHIFFPSLFSLSSFFFSTLTLYGLKNYKIWLLYTPTFTLLHITSLRHF